MDARTPDAPRSPIAVPSDDALALEIDALSGLDHHELRVRWRKLTRTAPPQLPRWLLQRLIAYRMQARAYGDLDPETARYLRQIDKERRRRRSSADADQRKAKAPPPIPPVPAYRGLKSGAVLAREFAGQMHTVTVVPNGFAWNGATYTNLSEIARAITGTRWNGPRFFGLRESAKPSEGSAP